MLNSNLPFPRGGTASDFGLPGVTTSDTWLDKWEGQEFEVDDTRHGTGHKVRLRIVKNDTGAVITPANQLLRFNTNAKDFGRRIAGVSNSKATVCVPIDDEYNYNGTTVVASPQTIPDDDLFYVVIKGPNYVMTDAANVGLAAHDNIVSDGSTGTMYKSPALAGEFSPGTIDAATVAEDTAVLVWVDVNFKTAATSGMGAVPAAVLDTVVAAESGNSVIHKTIITCTAVPLVLTDESGTVVYGGVQIYDFPEGLICTLGAVVTGSMTGVEVNATWEGDVALGSVTATTGASLTGTEADIMPSVDIAAATAKVGPVDAVSVATALTESGALWYDGTATALNMFLNFNVDEDGANATSTGAFTGTIAITWMNLGDN